MRGNGGPWRRWLGAGLSLAVLVPVVVLAIRAEGFRATKLNLDDAGVWVVNEREGLVGRINTQIGRLEVAVGPGGADFDLQQLDETVVVELRDKDALAMVDVTMAEMGKPITVPDRAQVHVGGGTAALADPGTGKVWVTGRDRVREFDPVVPPRIEATHRTEAGDAETTVTVVGVDGAVHAYTEGTTERHAAGAEGDARTEAVPVALSRPQITAVGPDVVLLETDSGRLVLPDGRIVDLGRDRHPRLQQAGPDHHEVLVATDSELVAVSLADGAVRTVVGGGGGAAVAPVLSEGCAFAAWADKPRWAQICPGHPDRGGELGKLGTRLRDLQFRVNRRRVVLNDGGSGFSLLFTERDPIEVTNWKDALRPGDDQDRTQERIVQKPKEACTAETEAGGRLEDDRAGTRLGRPVIVPVLANDKFSACHVPVVTVPEPPPVQVAAVAVVQDGTAIQVTPAPEAEGTIGFSYQVDVGDRVETARVTVDVVEPDENKPPTTTEDTTTVVAGRTVRHDVLANDIDPEGDALTVTTVRLDGGEGSFTYRADGSVTYTAAGGKAGEQRLIYTVVDEFGAAAEGTLRVIVTEEHVNVAPTARPDRAEAVVGRPTTVAVLENDSDPNGDTLTVSSVTGVPGDLEVERSADGRLRVIARRAGASTFTYAITDGEHVAEGRVRIDATEPAGNRPPVAVRDDLSVRPGVPAFADLVANDFDADGDLLAVTQVEAGPYGGLAVELLDLHMVRVTAPAGFTGSVRVRYTVSDGAAATDGFLIVRAYDDDLVGQPPVVVDDEVSVRAGNVTAVPVLVNDTDPEGERLEIVAVREPVDGEGSWFVQGDELRYQAPAAGPDTIRFTYTVTDPDGNRADGQVTVRVLPADHPNQPPIGPTVEARVFAGGEITIPVPLLGADPDGDVVAVVGISDRDGEQPTKGQVEPGPGGLRYRADRGASGTDTFGFIVRDAYGLEATGRARVAVVARPVLNAPPVAVPDKVTTKPGGTVPVPVLANDSDPDGDPLTVLASGKDAPSRPRGGEVAVAPDGTISLVIAPTAPQGEVSFSYTVSDGRGGTARGVVTVTIDDDPPDLPPVARDDVLGAQEPGATVDVEVLANDDDPEGGALRVAVADPSVGARVLPDGKIQVRVGERSLSFVYSVTDPAGQVGRAAVVVPVAGDRPPECRTGSVEVAAGESVPVDVVALCRDPDGNDVRLVRLLGNPRGGTADIDGAGVRFAAAPEVRGDGGFQFVVSDGMQTAVGGVVVRITGGNSPPVLAGSTIELPAGGDRAVDLALLVNDPDPTDRHTFTLTGGGTDEIPVALDGNVLRVQATDDARDARTTVTVTVSDGREEATGRLEVRVLPHDGQPPVAVDDEAPPTIQGRSVTYDVTVNDIDPLGKGLTVEAVNASNGSATIDGTRLTYTPAPDFFGNATISYRIMDGTRDTTRTSAAVLRVSVIGRPSRPGAPTGIAESRLVRLSWGAAAPNGGPITEYVVEGLPGGRRTTASTSLTFDGLSNGTAYRFRVAARNQAVVDDGQLLWSELSAPITPDIAPGTPAPPRLQFGDGQVTVTWSPPANDGTPIRNYQLRVSGGAAQPAKDVGTATSYTWTALQNGTQYSFSVRAENGSGFGEWSSPSNDPVNGTPAGVPGGVPDVSAARLDRAVATGGWVQVRWGTPAANGDSPSRFHVTVSPADVPPQTVTNAGQRSLDIAGLRNGVTYTFSVVAENKAGRGPAGSASATPAAVPSPVDFVRADVGDRSATLFVNAPPGNGAPVNGWDVSINGGGFGRIAGPANPRPGDTIRFEVTGLTNGQRHTFRIRACNEVGCADGGPESNGVNPFGRPDAPEVAVAMSGQEVSWSWNQPNGNGRAVKAYEVFLNGDSVGTQTDRRYTRTFPNGGTFTLAVVAINEGDLRSNRGTSAQVRVDPPYIEARTIDNGIWKDTFSTPGAGADGRRNNVVPPGTVQKIACKRLFTPDIGSNPSGYWFRMVEWDQRWMPAGNYEGTPYTNPNLRSC